MSPGIGMTPSNMCLLHWLNNISCFKMIPKQDTYTHPWHIYCKGVLYRELYKNPYFFWYRPNQMGSSLKCREIVIFSLHEIILWFTHYFESYPCGKSDCNFFWDIWYIHPWHIYCKGVLYRELISETFVFVCYRQPWRLFLERKSPKMVLNFQILRDLKWVWHLQRCAIYIG